MKLKEQQYEIDGYSITLEYDDFNGLKQIIIQKRSGEVIFMGTPEELGEHQDITSKVLLEIVQPNIEGDLI